MLNRTLLLTTISSLLLATACVVPPTDAEAGADDGAGPGGGGSSATTGALLFEYAGEAVRYNLATKTEVTLDLHSNINERIGRAGDVMTDVTVDKQDTSGPSDDTYAVNVRRLTASGFDLIRTLEPFRLSTGFISGSVQPTPDGSRFAMHTVERAGLGEPQIDHVYVFTASGVQMRLAGYGYPVWLPDGRLVMRGDDGLYTITGSGTPTPQRLGATLPGSEPPSYLAVSPAGTAVAFVHGGAVWRMDLDGSNLQRLTQVSASPRWPAWSPDGTKLAVLIGVCSGVRPTSRAAVISSSQADQSLDAAPLIERKPGVYVVACGGMYWLP